MTDIPDLGPDYIVIPVTDLPAVTEDNEGAVAHLAFMRHLEADPDEAARVFRLAKCIADVDNWWTLSPKKRAKFMRQARLADRSARQAVSA